MAHRPALVQATGGEVGHCILFTRIAVDVCRARGVPSKALPVSVEITADADHEAQILLGVEGQKPEDAPDDFWDGHLVAILDRRLLLDLSIDSIAGAEIGVQPEPFVVEVSAEFAAGGAVEIGIRGGRARYRAQPEREDFRNSPGWERGTDNQIERLADALLWPS